MSPLCQEKVVSPVPSDTEQTRTSVFPSITCLLGQSFHGDRRHRIPVQSGDMRYDLTLGNIKAEVVGITLNMTADRMGNFEQDQKTEIFADRIEDGDCQF